MNSTLNIELVARAHQVVQDGYEFFANRKLVTIFSAPHYCGQFDNAAALMNVDENLVCSFTVRTYYYVKYFDVQCFRYFDRRRKPVKLFKDRECE
ncbi:hypothetical protein TELCIR_08865 [Teladorsagia circumcincta]|uniref:Serine/threonine specific protein phosphatases domain-containing protein n=1 Tax=Teladorsagia circumcincta TaxID=45464 RepID=A0A2G9UGG5_TELCI|nr:hypothetical protein TELCIR_08865 [Teladorsagia circumcincta]